MALIPSLPLFPLEVVLFPEEVLPLHIFEPRYRELVHTCLAQDRPFGIVLFTGGEIADVGCMARIRRVLHRYEDGRMDIQVEGFRRFRIRRLMHEHAYLTAEVETLDEPEAEVDNDLRERLITQHLKLLELAGRTVRPTIYQDVNRVSYFIAHNAGLSLGQQLEVLKLPTENERIAYLVEHLGGLLPRIEQVEEVRRKIRSNGHLRDFPPDAGEAER
ncbi:LON peptidase substrate-binding domain-containing protein [Rhodocaloribacter litoris]|uniref:LON peptidase substrate-binding domain-containing protein n=1 Tax=Rhodocaloribacter litoris TaxID=2558931 RepID=UPI00141EA85A|nr:LON peptidase substrate-binding domain-containing protein [Rhodocaloribacter litoris]QXD15728.1 LON peptidase substrate-binding domain-containing protein [Rhodocaloribacter litoris]GIV60228.1 MAG: ATP-dependent protease [Rhodothermaceae bacterium]